MISVNLLGESEVNGVRVHLHEQLTNVSDEGVTFLLGTLSLLSASNGRDFQKHDFTNNLELLSKLVSFEEVAKELHYKLYDQTSLPLEVKYISNEEKVKVELGLSSEGYLQCRLVRENKRRGVSFTIIPEECADNRPFLLNSGAVIHSGGIQGKPGEDIHTFLKITAE